MDTLEPIDLAGFAYLGLHREDLRQDLADGRRVGQRRKEHPTLLHSGRVRPFVVDELAFWRALDGTELEASFSDGKVGVHLFDLCDMLRAFQEGPGLPEVFV